MSNAKIDYRRECSWVRYCYRNNLDPYTGGTWWTWAAMQAYRQARVSFTGFHNKSREHQFISEKSGGLFG